MARDRMDDDDTVWAILDVFSDVDELMAYQIELQEKILNTLDSINNGDDGGGGDGGTSIQAGDIVGASSVSNLPVSPTSFEQRESEEDVTIEPGESKDVVSVELDKSALWYEVGDSDNPYSEYQYYADAAGILDNPQVEPLGLYNDPYRFPQPLIVRDTINVNVKRQKDASGPANYFSKVRYMPISDLAADKLDMIWRSV